MPRGKKPLPVHRRKMEDDDKPLDRLIGRGAPKRQARLYVDPATGKIGLLAAIKPKTAILDGDELLIIEHEETLPTKIEIAPGYAFRPELRISVTIHLTPEQAKQYRHYMQTLQAPADPIAP